MAGKFRDTQQTLLTLEQNMPYRLSVLSNKVNSIVANTYREQFELSINEWRIIAILGECPGESADEISFKTHIEKSLISRAIGKLLTRKLIDRKTSKEDKRRSEISLSDTGHQVYCEIMPVALAYEEKLLSCLSREERNQFSTLLAQLEKHVQTTK